MSVQRWLFATVGNLDERYTLTFSEQLQIYFMGFRFDLLILAFVLAPLFLLVPFRGNQKTVLTKIYLSLVWVFISFLNFINVPYFSLNRKFINHPDWETMNVRHSFEVWFIKQEPSLKFLAFIILLLILIRGILAIHRINVVENKKPSEVKVETLKLFVAFLAVVFCARGHLGSHHLRREDSQITLNPGWNELSLNPQWSFSKDDR